MILITIVLFACWSSSAFGQDCTNLTGTWRNQLGSNMTIEVIPGTNKVTGRYFTAVESSKGAASLSSNISGLVIPTSDGSLIGFNVLFNKGASLTAWVGQCLMCNGKAKIHTTWVLRSLQSAKNNWMSTRINQDTFWRLRDGYELPQNIIETASSGINAAAEGLNGTWSSALEDFTINTDSKIGTWEGSYRNSPSEDNEHGKVYGSVDGNGTYIALGFAAAGESGSVTITGSVGHIYNPTSETKVLQTSWLKQEFDYSCINPRRLVRFGMYNYSLPSDSS